MGKMAQFTIGLTGQGDHCITFTHGATMDHGLFQYEIEYFAQKHKVIVWRPSDRRLASTSYRWIQLPALEVDPGKVPMA